MLRSLLKLPPLVWSLKFIHGIISSPLLRLASIVAALVAGSDCDEGYRGSAKDEISIRSVVVARSGIRLKRWVFLRVRTSPGMTDPP